MTEREGEVGRAELEGSPRGMRKLLWVTAVLTPLTLVMVSWVYTQVKTFQGLPWWRSG